MARARRTGQRIVTGDKEIDAALQKLKVGAANRIARPALRKGARRLLKSVKAQIPRKYKDAKKAMGMAVNSKGGKSRRDPQAKVGAAVGKASRKSPFSRAGKRGVGMSARNIHWFILGTAQRSTGSTRIRTKDGAGRRRLTGGRVRNTGRMPPQIAGVDTVYRSHKTEVSGVIKDEAMRQLVNLVSK